MQATEQFLTLTNLLKNHGNMLFEKFRTVTVKFHHLVKKNTNPFKMWEHGGC